MAEFTLENFSIKSDAYDSDYSQANAKESNPLDLKFVSSKNVYDKDVNNYNFKVLMDKIIKLEESLNENPLLQLVDGSKKLIEIKLGNSNKTLLDLIYPVDALYISYSNINPSELFGGKWVRVAKGRTLVGLLPEDEKNTYMQAANDPDPYWCIEEKNNAGYYGGKVYRKIEQAHLPSHAHGLNNHKHEINLATEGAGDHQHNGSYLGLGGVTESKSGYDVIRPWYHTTYHGITTTTNSAGWHTHDIKGSTESANGTTGNCGGNVEFDITQPYVLCYMWKRKS